MEPVRIGVVGVGHLGRHHARLLRELEAAALVGVADVAQAARDAASEACGVPAHADYRVLAGQVDAVCVAVPTQQHREVAEFFLERGVDVLVEKPITTTPEEARVLCDVAAREGRILQVGHVERFNPALRAIAELGIRPRYIEAQRLAPFTFRSTDIGVVMDLMIHDLDLVRSLVAAPLRSVDAFGGSVFTPSEDMASAVLKFEDGSVAHLTANRVALRPMRRLRVFSRDAYVSVDLQASQGTVIRKREGARDVDLSRVDRAGIGDPWKFVFEELLSVQEYRADATNPLRDELAAFIASVRDRTRPAVDGEAGHAAVALAHRVLAAIATNPW